MLIIYVANYFKQTIGQFSHPKTICHLNYLHTEGRAFNLLIISST